jgi:hypothetical protein
MKNIRAIRLLLFIGIFGSCVGDPDLYNPVFIRDKNYPELPEYSEWGYNTFGAFFNDDVFVSSEKQWEPASVMQGESTMTLSFHGEKRVKGMDTTDMILNFIISRPATSYSNFLYSLNDSIIDLSTSSNQVQIMYDSTLYPVTITTGELHFKNVKNMVIDLEPMETIFSGTFDFEGIMNGNPVSVTLGRFDVGVNYY